MKTALRYFFIASCLVVIGLYEPVHTYLHRHLELLCGVLAGALLELLVCIHAFRQWVDDSDCEDIWYVPVVDSSDLLSMDTGHGTAKPRKA